MNNLPAEVYYHILRHLSRPEIQTCFFVCKRLNAVAVQVYSKYLIIDDYKVRLANVYLAGDNASKYLRNGRFVRKLTFKTEFEGEVEIFQDALETYDKKKERAPPSFSRYEFLLLLKYLPNIEEIDLTESGNFSEYVSFLFEENLQHLKRITSFPSESYCFDITYRPYFITCFRFRDTLTSLSFRYTETTNDYNYCGMDILTMLSQFKNLKQLIVYNTYCTDLIMFRIQEICPQLTELTFKSKYNYPDEVVQKSSNLKIEPIAKLNKSLRHLNIILSWLLIDYTKYLTSYIEDILHTVNIRTTSTGFYDWIEGVGMEDALELMKKLGQLNDVCISFARNNRPRRTRLSSELKTTKWFQIVNAFKGNKNALCTVKLYGVNYLGDSFKYSSLDKRLVLDYELDDVDVFGEEEEDHIHGLIGLFSKFISPTRSISTIGPEIIDSLELNFDDLEDYTVLKLLEYAFSNCINLQYITVENNLKIQRHPIQKAGELSSIQNNRKTVHFLNGAPTNYLFYGVSTHLPDTEVLILGSHSSFDTSFDLTLFKSLKRCYLIIQQGLNYICWSTALKFEYTNGKKQRYYYNGEVKKFFVREDTVRYPCRTFTFICEKDIEFNVCFESDESLLKFDIDNSQDRHYRIPTNLI